MIEKRRKQGNSRPIDREVAKGKSMENKLIWQYLCSEGPIHCRRTLDQYGYPSLRNTAVRDADQILYKRTKTDKEASLAKDSSKKSWHSGRSSSSQPAQSTPEDISAKVLMVDQLWVWVIDAGKYLKKESDNAFPIGIVISYTSPTSQIDSVWTDRVYRNCSHFCSSKGEGRRRWWDVEARRCPH